MEEQHRKPLLMWPAQISFDDRPKFTTDIVNFYHEYPKNSDVPKLMFYADSSLIINTKLAQHYMDTWNNLSAIDLGEGKHYLQESHSHELGEEIVIQEL